MDNLLPVCCFHSEATALHNEMDLINYKRWWECHFIKWSKGDKRGTMLGAKGDIVCPRKQDEGVRRRNKLRYILNFSLYKARKCLMTLTMPSVLGLNYLHKKWKRIKSKWSSPSLLLTPLSSKQILTRYKSSQAHQNELDVFLEQFHSTFLIEFHPRRVLKRLYNLASNGQQSK